MIIVLTTLHTANAVPCISVGMLVTCDLEGSGLFPDESMSDFRWEKWPWDRFLSHYFIFSPVITIPPLLHTHPFVYHRRCMNLLIQSASKWSSLKQNAEIHFKMLCRLFINVPEFAVVSVHTMKAYRGNWIMAPPILKLRNRWRWIENVPQQNEFGSVANTNGNNWTQSGTSGINFTTLHRRERLLFRALKS
jgi:hypothetical protein